ncbi:hypothetical protein GE061_007388 [Apolygus lucorum]|uniref:Uncharacterized protein n=1 Tax=Apolygus lucorum TaxID=248454 RepID=A0A6A4IZJ3_APOLU|nr:hypothetical protein GE061_007388 [Apolygus lucorum]
MRSHLIKGLLLLSCIFVLSESRSLNKKDKKYLLKRISEWDNAPECVKITKGTVTRKCGIMHYKFVYKTEDGSSCKAEMNVKKDGTGRYSWECDPTCKSDDEDCEDDSNLRRRHLRGNKKSTELKGSVEL